MASAPLPSAVVESVLPTGGFQLGVNYWASHAGPAMWERWDEAVVRADFDALAGAGMTFLRVFPNWHDFQPVRALRGGHGRVRGYAHGETPLAADNAAGLDPVMLARFRRLAELADEHGIRLVASLLTGWMSGRRYTPPLLDHRHLFNDPTARLWALRFARGFVEATRDCPAIVAWEPGNETNCLSPTDDPDAFAAWLAAVVSAIRAADPARPVFAGLHSAEADPGANVSMAMLGEWTDALTTHPYPLFTPGCDLDPMDTLRPAFHAAAESRLYADLSGRPCYVQEIGVLGDSVCGEAVAGAYAHGAMWAAWTQDTRAFQWWCAFDQGGLDRAPHTWNALERELGVFGDGYRPKPVLRAMTRMAESVRALPGGILPPCTREAVCVLGPGQRHWPVAYATFLLAKMAGFDLRFAWHDRPWPDAPLYLLPAIDGEGVVGRDAWRALLDRVRAGAALYVSYAGGQLAPFDEPIGATVRARRRATAAQTLAFAGWDGAPEHLTVNAPFRLDLAPTEAEVMARREDGSPAMLRRVWGKGTVFFNAVAPEAALAATPDAFHGPETTAYWRVYRHLAESAGALAGRVLTRLTPPLTATEHPVGDARRLVVVLNAGPDPAKVDLAACAPWRWVDDKAARTTRTIPPNDALWLEAERRDDPSRGEWETSARP